MFLLVGREERQADAVEDLLVVDLEELEHEGEVAAHCEEGEKLLGDLFVF